MAGTSSSRIFGKPLQRLRIDDWHSKANETCNSAIFQRSVAFDLRQTSRNLRKETQSNTNYNKINTNAYLSKR